MSENTYYLTTPIYYVNARPHIGHAYSTIVADVLARRHRLLGDATYFLTGTDEHGQKIERSAAAAGIPPQQFADQVSDTFKSLWKRMGITHDQFIRTTDARHKLGAQQLFRTIYEKGKHLENPYIYLSTYTGAYCVSDEAFVDAPVGTPCPDCGRILEQVTEENFFFRLSAFQEKLLDLIESNELLITPDSARNEVLSFIRGNVAGVATGIYDEKPSNKAGGAKSYTVEEVDGKLKKSASGQLFVPGALKDLSISRSSFTWGIPVPDDIQKEEKATQPHVIYVWLDALANYITALGYGSDDTTLFDKFWPANVHLVGKEITRFHCVYWPAFLMAAGIPTPKQVTANGWLLFDNSKMSKSKGNVVRTETILEGFGEHVYAKQFPESTPHERDLFATDVLRYYLLREIPFGQDGSFSFDAMITRYNADLANGYGNLVSRTLNMIQKYFPDEGVMNPLDHPEPPPEGPDDDHKLRFSSSTIIDAAPKWCSEAASFIDELRFTEGLQLLWKLISLIDSYISTNTPWAPGMSTSAGDTYVRAEILYTAAESLRILTCIAHPVLPYTTARVWQQLGLGDIEAAAANGELKNLEWGGLQPGTKLGTLAPIFPRADKGLANIMADIENPIPAPEPTETTHPAAGPRTASLPEPSGTLTVAGSAAHTTGPHATPSHSEIPGSGIFASQPPLTTENGELTTPQITIDDFAKIELRVAKITLAERIPKADKLLRLEVDLGPHGTRQILSGIAEFYTPEELTGRRIVVITNLAPRKMRGLESHGMLLAASEGEHGKPYLATCGEDIALGSRLK